MQSSERMTTAQRLALSDALAYTPFARVSQNITIALHFL
jgi:hypothetical protein